MCCIVDAMCGRDFDDELKAFILAKTEPFTYKQLSFLAEAPQTSIILTSQKSKLSGCHISHSANAPHNSEPAWALIPSSPQDGAVNTGLTLSHDGSDTNKMEMEAALLETAAARLAHLPPPS
jgi:hypothetical protein